MDKVKILHCADIHIGAAASFLGTLAESRRFEALATFERIVDLALQQEVDIVAVAGDLFDSNNLSDVFVKGVMDKIASAERIKFFYAAGNHDPLNDLSPFMSKSLPKNLFVLKDDAAYFELEELNLRVYGRCFESSSLEGEELFKASVDDRFINILVQHGELKTDLNSQYNAITPQFIKSCKMDYIALGHIHKRSEIGKLDNTYFAYCGCPEGQGFDECGQKGIYIGYIGKGVCELEFFPVARRLHCIESVDISNCSSAEDITQAVLDKLCNTYGDSFSENLYKIILTGTVEPSVQINPEELKTKLDKRVYYIKFKDSTELLLDYAALVNEPSLKGVFVKNMLGRIDRAAENEKTVLRQALKLGLKAFDSEVKYCED